MVDTNLDLNIDISTVPDLPFHVLKQYYMQLYNQETRIGNKEFYILRVSYRLQSTRLWHLPYDGLRCIVRFLIVSSYHFFVMGWQATLA